MAGTNTQKQKAPAVKSQLKAELMAKLEKAAEQVLAWCESYPSFTVTELEDFVLSVRESIGQEIASEEMLGQVPGKSPVEAGGCGRYGQPLEYKRQKQQRVVARLGELDVERGRYWCAGCATGFPPDEEVGLRRDGWSVQVVNLAV